MRKVKLFALASLVAGSLNAQYFQHVYGAQTRDILESGVNTNSASPQGHIMAGYTDYPGNPGLNSFMVTRTDLNGRFVLAPVFNNRYPVLENNVQVDAKARRVIHPTQLGGRICVWGDYGYTQTAPSTRFFYALLNPNGTVVAGGISSYNLNVPIVEARATSMIFSPTQANTVVVCGYVRIVAGGQLHPMVMRLNATTGAVVWSQVYQVGNNDWTAMDLVESPFPPLNTALGPDLALTGHMRRPGMSETGCFWMVPINAGWPLTAGLVEYGTPFTPNTDGAFNAIDVAFNPGNNGIQGFVLGGYYNNPDPASMTSDMWAIKIDPTGLIVDFSTLVDYSQGQRNEYANDIIERRNSLLPPNNYEYYMGGYVDNGIFGGEDDVVNKLDFTGIPFFPLPEFTYGGPGNERCMQLDQSNAFGPNNMGLSNYGRTIGSWPLLGANDFYLVKSYFNGVQTPTCPYTLKDPKYMKGPGIIEWWPATNPYTLQRRVPTYSAQPMQDWEICWAANDPAGSNARLAAAANSIEQPGYFPNPVSRENGLVTVTFGKEAVAGVAQVELRNALGQLVWSKQITVADGQTNMQIELGNELNTGMYHLIINQDGTMNNYRILVQ